MVNPALALISPAVTSTASTDSIISRTTSSSSQDATDSASTASDSPPSSDNSDSDVTSLIDYKRESNMPISSQFQSSLLPTTSFDDEEDFIPYPADSNSLRHSEFGHCTDPRFRATSVYRPGMSLEAVEEEPGYFIYLATCKKLVSILSRTNHLSSEKHFPLDSQTTPTSF
jgi:hypothetical protein